MFKLVIILTTECVHFEGNILTSWGVGITKLNFRIQDGHLWSSSRWRSWTNNPVQDIIEMYQPFIFERDISNSLSYSIWLLWIINIKSLINSFFAELKFVSLQSHVIFNSWSCGIDMGSSPVIWQTMIIH